MTFYVTDQKTVVIALLVFGAAAGILRDTVLAWRRLVPTGKIAEFFQDILLCLSLVSAYHMIAFVTNYGYVRWYGIASTFAGFFLYRATLSPLVLRLACIGVRLVIMTVSFILCPVRVLILLLVKCAAGIGRFTTACILRLDSQRKRKRLLRLSAMGF
ncbi:MAG: spore cortex biosynthesis protein YabQ [Clostridia bacterium]|nr:spore cortex biosynthesis protein YabQ [Clostridia bacterium]